MRLYRRSMILLYDSAEEHGEEEPVSDGGVIREDEEGATIEALVEGCPDH